MYTFFLFLICLSFHGSSFTFFHIDFLVFYNLLAKMPALTMEKKKLKTNLKKKLNFFSLKHPPATPECPQKISAHWSSRMAGNWWHIYECLVLLYRLSIYISILYYLEINFQHAYLSTNLSIFLSWRTYLSLCFLPTYRK